MNDKPSWQDEFDREFGNYDNSMFNVWKIGSAETSEKTFNQLKTFIQDLLDRKAREIEGMKIKPVPTGTISDVMNPLLHVQKAHDQALDQALSILKEE